ncbi:MAG TPA: prenyltransferase [Candidatus Margulisiibacteriota bacterium]|nr:prenyltransferase [Candidatus Margulisiibacteriota bacterium]
MNVSMWAKAVNVIPRVSKEEWDGLDVISRWLIATRSAVLVMTFISAAIAGLLAARAGHFNVLLWLMVTVGLLFAHATNNLVNDITDHLKGVDKDNYFRAQYGPQPLEHGLMTRGQAVLYTAVTGLIALGAGAILVAMRGEATLGLLAIGAFFVLFYTWPLKYIGMGEVAVILVWGPLMVGGGYYVITGETSFAVVCASLPVALAATTVLFGKHIDKLEADAGKGIRTMPVLLGEANARRATIAMFTLQYLLVAGLVLSGYLSWLLLAVLAALPWYMRALRVYRQPRPAGPPPEYPPNIWPLWFAAFAFQHTRRFGSLFLLGLAADVVARKLGIL